MCNQLVYISVNKLTHNYKYHHLCCFGYMILFMIFGTAIPTQVNQSIFPGCT